MKIFNISRIFIMVTYNNKMFMKCFVISFHNVSAKINKYAFFKPNEIDITLSTLWRRTVVSDGRDWTQQSDKTGLFFSCSLHFFPQSF